MGSSMLHTCWGFGHCSSGLAQEPPGITDRGLLRFHGSFGFDVSARVILILGRCDCCRSIV